MKLLGNFEDEYEAEALAQRLREAGVLPFVSSKATHALRTPAGAMTVGVWVVLNEQYDDALGVLSNPNHQVREPLSEADMERIERISQNRFSTLVEQYLYPACVVFAASLLVFFVYLHNVWGEVSDLQP